MSLYDERLKFFWVIKGLRIITLNKFMSDKMFIPIVKKMFNKIRVRALNDYKLREDQNADHIYNYE